MPGIPTFVEHFPYLGLFVLIIIGGLGFPFPEDTTLILCGFLVSINVINPVPAFLVVYTGLLITDFILYSVGKKYGRTIVSHRKFQTIISPESLAALEDKFNQKGILVILIGRHLAGLRAQLFLAAGVMRMPALKFIMADAVSSIFTIALMVGAGYMGGNSFQIIRRDMARVEHIGIVLALILILIWLFVRYFRSRGDRRSGGS